MKAFISYSLPDSQEYAVTLLARELQEQGFYPDTGPYKFNNTLDDETFFKIKSSHLFIGILMPTRAKSSASNQRVINEWEFAITRKIPSILLVEKSIMPNISTNQGANIVSFDKNQPDKAIEFVKKAMEEAQRPLKKDINNTVAWLLGGLALIALIGFLAKTVKKEQLVAA
jgi:hypothetical protein